MRAVIKLIASTRGTFEGLRNSIPLVGCTTVTCLAHSNKRLRD